jgi:hypothetical protein
MPVVLSQTWNRKPATVYTRALGRAIEIARTPEDLAAFLGSSPKEIRTWASGEANPPAPIFLAIVDILVANALTASALENLPSARARRSSVAG